MRTAFLAFAIAILTAGCGYKADLYLPKAKPGVLKPPPSAASPQPSAAPTQAPAAEPARPRQDDATRQ